MKRLSTHSANRSLLSPQPKFSWSILLLIASLIFNCILIFSSYQPCLKVDSIEFANIAKEYIEKSDILAPYNNKQLNNIDNNAGLLQQQQQQQQKEITTIQQSPQSQSVTNDVILNGEKKLWFDNHLFVFDDYKAAFCVIEKNSCTMFKQIFKRIRGKPDYLAKDYTKIHWLPYRGLQDISFNDEGKLKQVLNKENNYYLAAFVRDPLERLVSGYVDKCEKKRGVNLCDYARWSSVFQSKQNNPKLGNKIGTWGKEYRRITPSFQEWADGLLQCPCWPEVDKHFAPQNLFCNLWNYNHQYDIFRFENRTHRKIWMERAKLWENFGSYGWKTGGKMDSVNIVDYEPQTHQSTNAKRSDDRYVPYYAENSTLTALVIESYRNDYVLFDIQMSDWICNEKIVKTDRLKRAIRELPRRNRPPCPNLPWLWSAP